MQSIILPTEYKTADIASKQRIYGGRFGNEAGAIPWITMDEEVLTVDGVTGATYHNPCGSLTAQLTDPDKPVELRNPIDDTVIGISSYGYAMMIIYSLGRSMQLERDSAQQQVEE